MCQQIEDTSHEVFQYTFLHSLTDKKSWRIEAFERMSVTRTTPTMPMSLIKVDFPEIVKVKHHINAYFKNKGIGIWIVSWTHSKVEVL